MKAKQCELEEAFFSEMKLVFVYHIPRLQGQEPRRSTAQWLFSGEKKAEKNNPKTKQGASTGRRESDARHEYLMSFPAMTEFPSSRCAWSALGSDLFPLQPRRAE